MRGEPGSTLSYFFDFRGISILQYSRYRATLLSSPGLNVYMARPQASDTSGAGYRHLTGSASSCISEVRLSFATPAAGLERLHLYLPSSHYFYGAVYTLISTPESSPPLGPKLSLTDETLQSELNFSNILLLLKAEFL